MARHMVDERRIDPVAETAERNGATDNVQPAYRFELQARTPAGAQLVRIAEELAPRFAERAAEHDRDASYPFEAIDALKAAGYFAAPVPEEFGGLGVESFHDILVASSRLARGDASVTIGVNMHLAAAIDVARRWREARAAGDDARAGPYVAMLQAIGSGAVVMAAGVSEANQHLTRPAATAIREGDGVVVNGHKIFCTMSPAANMIYVAVTMSGDDSKDRFCYAMVPKELPGVTVNDDWDALGMRASGSNSVTFENVRVPADMIFGGFPAGELSFGFLDTNLTAGPFHASASLGIAEVTHAEAMRSLAKKGSPRPRDLMLAAESTIDVSAMRAILSRAGTLIDEYIARAVTAHPTLGEVTGVFAEGQAAKAFINERSVQVVDRAMAISGGAGYMAKHPFARAYRDVRAGAFMHYLGANRAYEFIGQAALGQRPDLP